MQIRTDRGWIRAGLAVLVTGVLGGGVMAAACGTSSPHKVTAEGVTGSPTAAGAAPTPPAAGPSTAPDGEKKSDPAVGEQVAVGDDGGSVTVSAVEDNVSAGRLFGAGEGNRYIAAEVKGCSGPNEKNLSFEPAYFLLRLDDGTVHDPGAQAKKPSLDGGTVPVGKCLSGWVTFTVKEGALPTAVIYDGSSRLMWTVPLPKGAKPTTTTTMRPGATTTTADGGADGAKATTSTSSKPKTTSTTAKTTTSTTAKTTVTTARGSTATTSKSSTTTGKGSPTTTTAKSSGSTATTSKSGSASTSTTSSSGAKSGTTSTTGPAKASTTTTTGPSVGVGPPDSDG